MNFDRITYKATGKARFKASYWKSVVAALVLAFATGTLNLRFNYNFSSLDDIDVSELRRVFTEMFDSFRSTDFREVGSAISSIRFDSSDLAILSGVLIFLVVIFAIALVFATVFTVFVLNPLQVGAVSYFTKNVDSDAALGELGSGFSQARYLGVIKVMFLKGLYTFLWSLLLVVPGIIKSYEYRFIPYLASAHPEMDSNTLFQASRAMTDGRKMQLFIMDLSFLGWRLLGAVTFGLVNIFWTTPYRESAFAACYKSIAWEWGL